MHRPGQSIKLLLDPNKVSSPTFAKGSRNNSMYYYSLTLAIYEPLLDIRTKQDQEKTPRQIVNDASKFLQTLVRLHYLRRKHNSCPYTSPNPLCYGMSRMQHFRLRSWGLTGSRFFRRYGPLHRHSARNGRLQVHRRDWRRSSRV